VPLHLLKRSGPRQWSAGMVEAINVEDDNFNLRMGWSPGTVCPYRVQLDDGRMSFAPDDDDELIRAGTPPAEQTGRGMIGSMLQRVFSGRSRENQTQPRRRSERNSSAGQRRGGRQRASAQRRSAAPVQRGLSEYDLQQSVAERNFMGESDPLKGENTTCVICMEQYEEGDGLCTLACFHVFHKDCILEWLKTHNTCPICKTSFAQQVWV